jgi:hypothetical protein
VESKIHAGKLKGWPVIQVVDSEYIVICNLELQAGNERVNLHSKNFMIHATAGSA